MACPSVKGTSLPRGWQVAPSASELPGKVGPWDASGPRPSSVHPTEEAVPPYYLQILATWGDMMSGERALWRGRGS